MTSADRGSQARLFASNRVAGYRPKKCKRCSIEFQPLSGNQCYCTKECAYSDSLTERVCAHCQESFSRSRFGPATRFCSWKCRDVHRFGEKLEVPCKGCGAMFVKRRENHRWCSQGCANAARQRSRKSRGLHPGEWSLKLKGEPHCRRCGRDANHLHHIVPRSKSRLGRSDWANNGMPLCAECHRGWHDRYVTITSDCLRPNELEFAIVNGGAVWLDRNYPRPGGELHEPTPCESFTEAYRKVVRHPGGH